MRIDHDDMPFRRRLANPVEDQGSAGRLTRTGRSKQSEMLAQHGIDIDPGANILGRIDLSDRHRAAPVARIDLPEVGGGRRKNHRTGHRIACHTAPETVEAASQLLLDALAEEVDIGQNGAGLAVLFLVAHARQKPAAADADLDLRTDLTSHSDSGITILRTFGETLEIDGDHRSGAGNFQHHADGLHRIIADRFLFLLRLRFGCRLRLWRKLGWPWRGFAKAGSGGLRGLFLRLGRRSPLNGRFSNRWLRNGRYRRRLFRRCRLLVNVARSRNRATCCALIAFVRAPDTVTQRTGTGLLGLHLATTAETTKNAITRITHYPALILGVSTTCGRSDRSPIRVKIGSTILSIDLLRAAQRAFPHPTPYRPKEIPRSIRRRVPIDWR